jgi:hypothetical protein
MVEKLLKLCQELDARGLGEESEGLFEDWKQNRIEDQQEAVQITGAYADHMLIIDFDGVLIDWQPPGLEVKYEDGHIINIRLYDKEEYKKMIAFTAQHPQHGRAISQEVRQARQTAIQESVMLVKQHAKEHGNNSVIVLSARPPGYNNGDIKQFINIFDLQAQIRTYVPKSDFVKALIDKNPNVQSVTFIDDDWRNVMPVEDLSLKYPDINIKAILYTGESRRQ